MRTKAGEFFAATVKIIVQKPNIVEQNKNLAEAAAKTLVGLELEIRWDAQF